MRPMCEPRTRVRILAAIVALSLVAGGVVAVRADDKMDAEQVVAKAKLVVESFTVDEKMGSLREDAKNAKAVLVIPQALRGAFIIGAEGGSGVLVARDPKTKRWLGPTFHTIGGASFGFQAGADAAEVIAVAMTERGLTNLLNPNVKLGGDVSVAVGPVGTGRGGATAGLSADILVYSRSKGLYGGFSIEGSVVRVRDSLNKAYYGKEASPTDVLVRGNPRNPKGEPLLKAIDKLAAAK
ncbi:MAG TPA: lipid-binding SYLF domain-containing protein [Methylomirabilota bacterium]|nr:lipid-binding SYLF domain-containing protein [Methylomirabilota bacterium]